MDVGRSVNASSRIMDLPRHAEMRPITHDDFAQLFIPLQSHLCLEVLMIGSLSRAPWTLVRLHVLNGRCHLRCYVIMNSEHRHPRTQPFVSHKRGSRVKMLQDRPAIRLKQSIVVMHISLLCIKQNLMR